MFVFSVNLVQQKSEEIAGEISCFKADDVLYSFSLTQFLSFCRCFVCPSRWIQIYATFPPDPIHSIRRHTSYLCSLLHLVCSFNACCLLCVWCRSHFFTVNQIIPRFIYNF